MHLDKKVKSIHRFIFLFLLIYDFDALNYPKK